MIDCVLHSIPSPCFPPLCFFASFLLGQVDPQRSPAPINPLRPSGGNLISLHPPQASAFFPQCSAYLSPTVLALTCLQRFWRSPVPFRALKRAAFAQITRSQGAHLICPSFHPALICPSYHPTLTDLSLIAFSADLSLIISSADLSLVTSSAALSLVASSVELFKATPHHLTICGTDLLHWGCMSSLPIPLTKLVSRPQSRSIFLLNLKLLLSPPLSQRLSSRYTQNVPHPLR